MKIRTSYFYQIRNFKKNYIPISTCLFDPKWYHDFTNDYSYIFKDKRGILNGLRIESIIEQGRQLNHGPEICPCENKDYNTCSFLCNYRKNLENINFNKMIADMQKLANDYQKEEKIEEEIILVLIVYEVPNNPCSERKPLQDFFTSHGWECKELDYPINSFHVIKDELFDF